MNKYANQYTSEVVHKVFGDEDPYYQEIEVVKPNGTKKIKRVWREPPEQGLSEGDRKIMRHFMSRAWHLDMMFSVCGFRWGWSAIIAFIPFLGDCINIYFALQLIRMAQKVDGGLPAIEQSKMLTNIGVDFAIGFVPILGMVANALYKCNSRNALIFEHYMQKRAQKNIAAGKFMSSDSPVKSGWFGFGRNKKGGAAGGAPSQPAVGTEPGDDLDLLTPNDHSLDPHQRVPVENIASPPSNVQYSHTHQTEATPVTPTHGARLDVPGDLQTGTFAGSSGAY